MNGYIDYFYTDEQIGLFIILFKTPMTKTNITGSYGHYVLLQITQNIRKWNTVFRIYNTL